MPIICEVCNSPIENAKPTQKYHQGDCAWRGHLDQCNKRSKEKWLKKSPIVIINCPFCKEDYQTRKNKLAKTCTKEKCKNAFQRLKKKKMLEKMTIEEWNARNKLKYKKYKDRIAEYKDERNNIFQTIDTKCPGCGVIHQYTFEPAWIGNGMPRIGCPRYPRCINDGIPIDEKGWRGSFGEVYQSDNRAMI